MMVAGGVITRNPELRARRNRHGTPDPIGRDARPIGAGRKLDSAEGRGDGGPGGAEGVFFDFVAHADDTVDARRGEVEVDEVLERAEHLRQS